MRRLEHVLSHNKQIQFPQRMLFFDTETVPHKINEKTLEHQFRLLVAKYCEVSHKAHGKFREVYFRTKNAKEFIDYIESKVSSKRVLYCFAHNVWFDLMALNAVDELRKRGWRITGQIIASSPNMLELKLGDKTIRFYDTMNYFQFSLATLGEQFGLPKLKIPSFKASDRVWFEYCKRDVDILSKAILYLIQFLREYNLCGFKLSAASLAFATFRHKFLTHHIYIHSNKQVLELERGAYYGGRVECFRIGKYRGKFYQLDVNSMYPSVMLEHFYPTRMVDYRRNVRLDDEVLRNDDYCFIVYCVVRTNEPAFPLRYEKKLLFPLGQFPTFLADAEFRYALEKGCVYRIMDLAVYESAPIFRQYVKELYNMRLLFRQQGNYIYDAFCKRLLNSLYGKFGQKGEEWDFCEYNPNLEDGYFEEYDAVTHELHQFRVLGGRVEKRKTKCESYNSFPAIAACVTSEARMYLWHLMKRAGREHVFYCDSDSLIVDEAGYRNLSDMIHPDRLGLLKIEQEADTLIIYGNKDYVLGDKIVRKGIRFDAIQLADNVFEQEQFRGMRRALREGDTSRILVEKIVKELARNYDKGVVETDGAVRPFILNL